MISVKTMESRRTVKIQSDKDILKKRNQHLQNVANEAILP